MADVIKDGYLTKQGGVRKNWKKRWFVLRITELGYYAKQFSAGKSGDLKGTIQLAEIQDVRPGVPADCAKSNAIIIDTGDRVFKLCANSAAEQSEWVLAIKAGIKTAKLSTQPSPNKSHRRNLSTHSVDSVVSIGKEQDSSRVNTPTPSPLSSTTPEPSSAPRSEPRGEPRGEPDSQDGAGKQQDDDVNEHDGTDSRAEAEAAATVANPSTSDAAPDIDTTNAGSDGDGSAVPGDDGSAIADDLDVDALEFCFRAKALYEFVAADEEELSFPAGVVIEVLSAQHPEWWIGRLDKLFGHFPANRVCKLDADNNMLDADGNIVTPPDKTEDNHDENDAATAEVTADEPDTAVSRGVEFAVEAKAAVSADGPAAVAILDESDAEAKADSPADDTAKADEPVAEVTTDEPAAEPKTDEPVAEAAPDKPAAEAKADVPVAEAKADDPVADAKADEPVAEVKADKPIIEATAKEPAAAAKADEPAAEAKADEPAAEAKADEPAAEAKADEPTIEATAKEPAAAAKADEPAAEAKADELTIKATAKEPAATAKADEPAAEAKADELTIKATAKEPAATAKADEPAAEAKAEEPVIKIIDAATEPAATEPADDDDAALFAAAVKELDGQPLDESVLSEILADTRDNEKEPSRPRRPKDIVNTKQALRAMLSKQSSRPVKKWARPEDSDVATPTHTYRVQGEIVTEDPMLKEVAGQKIDGSSDLGRVLASMRSKRAASLKVKAGKQKQQDANK